MAEIKVASGGVESGLAELGSPLPLDAILGGSGCWEVEIGFGKGRFLLEQSAQRPDDRFLGIEVASHYYRLVRDRAAKRGLKNIVLIRGEALYVLSAVLPSGFASSVHVYFPDPWPKARHHERRLFDAQSVDLLLRLLAADGKLLFASDFLDYAAVVAGILDGHPGVERRKIAGPWGGEPRTNYEAKYMAEGRPIARFEVSRRGSPGDRVLHPGAARDVRVAFRAPDEPGEDS